MVMERPGIPQVSEAEGREIRGAFRDLYVTMREAFQPETIELRRRSESTGNFATVATFQPETLSLPRVQDRTGATNVGMVRATREGRMSVAGTIDIRKDDRFDLNGRTAVVQWADPVVNAIGYRIVMFELEG